MNNLSLREIAKLAGVSLGTVSNVIKNPEKVNPEKRSKVMQVMKDLEYDIMQNNPPKKLSNTIGLIISNINNPLFPPIIKSIQEVLDNHGYSLILCNTDKSTDKEMHYTQILEEKGVSGVIINSASDSSNYHHIYKIKEKGIPIVLINRKTEDSTINTIEMETFRGVYDAITYLFRLNHRRIAFLSGPFRKDGDFFRRYKGYLWAHEHNGIRVDENILFTSEDEPFYSGYKMGKEMHKKLKNKMPTAIFAANDAIAIGALRYYTDQGLKIPEDLSIVGFNDSIFANYTNPPLTTVNFPVLEAGEMAINQILQEINNKKNEPLQKILSCNLIVRSSATKIKG
jgi:LacI family transcriptional regulator